MNIGENIKKSRNDNKIKQLDLAKTLGISVRTLQKYESGEINPPLDRINKIADALSVTTNDLIGNDTFDIKAKRAYYDNLNNDELVTLLKPIGLNEHNFKSMSKEDKNDFINNLVDIDPLRIKLKGYMDNFESFTKEDLFNFYNEIKQYEFSVFERFIDEVHNPIVDKCEHYIKQTMKLVEIMEKKDKLIDEVHKILNVSNPPTTPEDDKK